MKKTKSIILSILVLLQISCSDKKEQKNAVEPEIIVEISTNSSERDLSEYHSEFDTIFFKTERGDIYKYERTIYNQIIDNHPEFFSDNPEEPEVSYQISADFENFGSETGEDNYFVLFAHFLKKKNGTENLKKERNKLIEIYTRINSIFQRLQYGGTYFGHQYYRILGLAEYSLYQMPKNNIKFEKTYNISKQKELYIESIRQLATDENSIDSETIGEENKRQRLHELNQEIDELDNLLSDIFYLRKAQEFQYRYYNYY